MSALGRRYRALHEGTEAEAEAEALAARAEAERAGLEVVAVSACLLGERVRHDGGDKRAAAALALAEGGACVPLPVCPELLAGLGCPRPAIAFQAGDGEALLDGRGRAVDARGADAGAALLRGARRTARLVALAGARRAVLKQRSPSCGTRQVHGPGGIGPGRGATAALLAREGIRLLDEVELARGEGAPVPRSPEAGSGG